MIRIALLIVLACGAAACSSTPRADSSAAPGALKELVLFMRSDDGRAAYYQLDRQGVLNFAGGHQAFAKVGQPLGTLTDEQRASLESIIAQYRLMEARGKLFHGDSTADYQISLKTTDGRNSFNTADDRIPGAKALYEKLNEIRVAHRYGQIVKPIEATIERYDGNVERK